MARQPPTCISRLAPAPCTTSEGAKEAVPDSLMSTSEVKAHWMDLGHVLILEPITMCVGMWSVLIGQAWACACPRCEEVESDLRKCRSSLRGRGPDGEPESLSRGQEVPGTGSSGLPAMSPAILPSFRGRALWFSKPLALSGTIWIKIPNLPLAVGDLESCQDS